MIQSLIYKVNIVPEGIPTTVRLSQNENGRSLQFSIIGDRVSIPAGSVVTISGTKPDGHVYSAEGTMTGLVATFDEDEQMTAVAGEWAARLTITYNGETVATHKLWFNIEADPVAAGSVPSDSELSGLVAEARQYAENARSAAYGSPLSADTAAGMIDVTKAYVYTGSETGYIFGHWYYYDGSAWVDGGVYQSQGVTTDPSLSILGMAADAKAVGDALDEKVDQEAGKGLSSNDYTTAEKTKLAGIAAGATAVQIDNTLAVAGKAADAKKVGDELTGLKEDLRDTNTAVSGKVDKVSGKVLSSNDYTNEEKVKLSSIAVGATKVEIDATLEQTGKAADAKIVGDAFANIVYNIDTSLQKVAEEFEEIVISNSIPLTFEQGGINVSDGAPSTSVIRIRSQYIPFAQSMTLTGDAAVRYSLRGYAQNNEYIEYTSWTTGTSVVRFTSDSVTQFRVVVGYVNDSNISPSSDFTVSLLEKSYTDATLSISGKSADAKTTGDILWNDDVPMYFENGSLIMGTGVETASVTAGRTGYLRTDINSSIVVDSSIQLNGYFYDENKAFLRRVENVTRLYNTNAQNAQYVRLVALHQDRRIVKNADEEFSPLITVKKMLRMADNNLFLNETKKRIATIENDGTIYTNPVLFTGSYSDQGEIRYSTNRAYTTPGKLAEYYNIIPNDSTVQLSWREYDACGNVYRGVSGWETSYKAIPLVLDDVVLLRANFEYGTISQTTGLPSEVSVARVRTTNYIPYNALDSIAIPTTHKVGFRFYDGDFNLIGTSNMSTFSVTVTVGSVAETARVQSPVYYKMIFAAENGTDAIDLTIFGTSIVVAKKSVAIDMISYNVRYSNDRDIADISDLQKKVVVQKSIGNHVLYERINRQDTEDMPTIYAQNTGNCTIRSAKIHNYIDGSPSVVEWYLLEEPETKRFFWSKDLQEKHYMFTFVGNSDWYSFGVTKDGDVIAVQDAATFPWIPAAESGYYVGDENSRKNPIVFIAAEKWGVQHEVDFGDSLKPCGWDKNVRCRVMASDGSFMFVEYTRPTVRTCNIWKISGNPLDSENWTYNQSMQLQLSGSNSVGLKHYHYILEDPYTGVVYVGTGDDDNGSMAWYSTNGGVTFTQITVPSGGETISHSEMYFRLLNYIFTPDYIYWAGDTNKTGKHKVFRCERDANGVLDTSTLFVLANLSSYNADRATWNGLSSYGAVLIPECNAILLIERVDGSTANISKVPIRVIDLSINDEEIVFDGNYNSNNVVETFMLEPAGTNKNIGFEVRYMSVYPVNNVVYMGYNLLTVSSLQDANPNKGFGNTGNGGKNGINNLNIRIAKCDGKFVVELGTAYQ